MGLSQLLAVGRSVRTIKDGPASYKMRQQALLPKFGAEKAVLSRAPETAPSVAEAVPELARPEPSARPPEALESGTEESREESDPGPARVAAFVAATKKLGPFGVLARFRNPFGSGRERGSAPLQTELGLEAVRPVRNDLSDGPVEIPVVPRAVPQPEPMPARARAPVPALAVPRGPLWQRVKKRWFGGRHPNRPQLP